MHTLAFRVGVRFANEYNGQTLPRRPESFPAEAPYWEIWAHHQCRTLGIVLILLLLLKKSLSAVTFLAMACGSPNKMSVRLTSTSVAKPPLHRVVVPPSCLYLGCDTAEHVKETFRDTEAVPAVAPAPSAADGLTCGINDGPNSGLLGRCCSGNITMGVLLPHDTHKKVGRFHSSLHTLVSFNKYIDLTSP